MKGDVREGDEGGRKRERSRLDERLGQLGGSNGRSGRYENARVHRLRCREGAVERGEVKFAELVGNRERQGDSVGKHSRGREFKYALHQSCVEALCAKGKGEVRGIASDETKSCFSALSSLFLTLHPLNSKSLSDSLNSLKMSTSATPQGLGECVVCGKESSTRCSKCDSAGLDWMFFCGQEHQKLVSSSCPIATHY